jgi:Co/Zn/Cd efflux system component
MAHSFGSAKSQGQQFTPLPSLAPMSPYGTGYQHATDGAKTHPLQDTLAAVTVILAAVAIATCAFRGLHLVASWTGLAGILTAAVGQYISVTTTERFVLVCAGVVAAAGFGIGLAHGGLY